MLSRSANGFFSLIVLVLIIINTHPCFAQEGKYVFNYLTVDQGLSQNEVTSILQDHTGFMWFATRGGLNRYDGKNFLQFDSDPAENNPLVNPSIERIFQTRDKIIWIGSKSGGLSSYDPVHGVFKNYYNPDKTSRDKCWGQRVISFFEDESNRLWIGTWSDGVFIRENNQTGFQHLLGNQQVGSVIQTRDKRIWAGTSNGLYVYSTKDRNFFPVPWKIKENQIVSMVEDPLEPVIWVVGWGLGLVRFDYITGTVRQFIPEKGQQGSSSSYSIVMDSSRQIWMGTWGGGLYKFNQANSEFEKIRIKPAFQIDQNIDYGVILDLYFDKQGILWIGTDGGGVCQLIRKQPFSSFTYSDGLLNTHVLCIEKDSQNTLWIGTRGGGLYYKKDKQSIHALKDDNTKNKLILSLFRGSDGTFWVGQDYGASIVSYRNGQYELLSAGVKFGTRDFDPLRKILGFLEDDNSIWMGTKENGLYIFEKTGSSYRRKRHFLPSEKPGTLKNDRISSIFKDSDNNIWIGTYHGLYLFSRSDSSFLPADELLVTKNSLTSNIIHYVTQDLQKNLWIATPNGLNKLSCIGKRRYKVNNYRIKDGLANNYVHAILVDSLNNLWVSTYSGISKFDNSLGKFINYGIADGLPGKTFSEAAACRSSGTFYFGGINGVTSFNPLQINESRRIPEIRFTSLSIFNHDVKIGETINKRIILPVSLDQVNDLKFTYRDREMTFGFAALNYVSSDKNRYAYKLEGYNKSWVSLGNRSFVSFNNLKPGSYVLKVKGSNNNNVWNNTGISLNFKVLPPPWKTWYAYIIYALLIAGLAFLIWSATFKRLQLEQKIEIEKIRVQQEVELNKLKIDFFTSISHEIRTPLTLIFAPLEELMSRFSGNDDTKIIYKLNLISLNAKKLLALINQLLDFRKVESGRMEIKVTNRIIDETIENICLPYKDLARSQSKKFVTEFRNREKELWYDENMVEIIMNNLLSNAFKFCPEDGTVRVNVYEEDVHLIIDVIDNGQGIPSEELDKIFNRFYQSKMNTAGGTGIGLFLVKKYIELHKGSVEVQCVPDATTFRLKFLKGSDHFTPDQIEQNLPATLPDRKIDNNNVPPVRITSPEKNLSHKILIIDDNKELRDYLEEMFGEMYIILTADNGLDGYHLIISENPDLVISDITMPKLDGLELCKRVKKNDHLKHVPFLLLTARNAEKYILLGTKYGADDYITKPFNYQILKHKVDNLISTHVRLQNKYSQKLILEPSRVEISHSEEIFLKKVVDLIEKNISNPDFNPGVLASKVNMSQSSLYRRLHAVSNQTVNELIREIRIKRSAQFLADKEKTISEIAYEVGFNDVKYFRKSFQKQFGKSPSEYRSDMLNKPIDH